jgi:DNA replication protein DnaC
MDDLKCPMPVRCGLEDCGENCIIRKRLFFLMKRAHFPSWMIDPKEWVFESPSEADNEAYNTLENIETRIDEFMDGGNSLYLYGPTGTGKSIWARRLCMAYFIYIAISGTSSRHLLINSLPATIFTDVSDFFLRYKGSWTPKSGLSQIYTLDEIYKVPLLVFDDIGVTNPTEYEKSVIHAIINSRTDNRKTTIYTSNLDPHSFEAVFGQALVSRIISVSVGVKLEGNN